MSNAWLISYLSLWGLVAFLVVVTVALARQVGLLSAVLAPPGARLTAGGPAIGAPAPELTGTDLAGRQVKLGASRKQTLVIFVSPSCGPCVELLPAVKSIHETHRRRLDVVLVSLSGEQAANHDFAERHQLGQIPLLVSPELGATWSVRSTPYALLVDEEGLVRAKGITNQFLHLQSLLNAAELGHPTMESFLSARAGGSKSVRSVQ